jgi:hypothetical protein
VNDFIGRGVGSPLFSLLFIALKTKRAKDWYSGIQIALNPIGKSHSIQYHHIFPKSLLKNTYEKSEINELTNMAFIAGKTNLSISNKPPKEYLQPIINSARVKTVTDHYVPIDEDLLEISNYRAFLEKRRMMLAEMLNTFVEELIH